MSLRNVRKLYGGNTLPPPEDSDDDYEPLYVKAHSAFDGLVVSDGDSDNRSPLEEEDEEEKAAVAAASNSQGAKKKQKRKSKAKAKKSQSFVDEEDEVERSLRDVNAILGAPPPAPAPVEVRVNEGRGVMTVLAKHLNVNNELRRLFGPPEREENHRNRHHSLMLKRIAIWPLHDTFLYDFRRTGLSMSINKRENGYIYFTYDHNQDYQKMHRSYISVYTPELYEQMLRKYVDYREQMHIEAMLEVIDILFHVEEYSLANQIIENVTVYLQHIAHPSFNLTNSNVRLDYSYLENRPFFAVMLKYIYALTNKACHRTALEIAKMMLNIDPKDPVAVLFVIDTLALRAREHKWLIEACVYFDVERNGSMLCNIQYSKALAHYHVAQKENKENIIVADKLLQSAMLHFPLATVKIMEFANQRPAAIVNHELFTVEPRTNANAALNELVEVYAKMTWQRWREPGVSDWFFRNANELCEKYNNDAQIRETAKMQVEIRRGLFPRWSKEVCRHFAIIEPMAPLVLDMPLKEFARDSCGWNPLFDRGINRYNYSGVTTGEPPTPQTPSPQAPGAAVYSFFASMLPNYNVENDE